MKFTPDKDFWKRMGLPNPVAEFRFHPDRKWRFDYAWNIPDGKTIVGECIAVEIEGGIWTRGGHTRGAHFMSDSGKYNEALRLGWKVYRFTPEQLQKDMEIHRYPKTYKGKRESVSEFLRSVIIK